MTHEFASEKVKCRSSRYDMYHQRREWEPENYVGSVEAQSMEEVDWKEVMKHTEKGFSETLLEMIDERGMKDSQCYKSAQVDKRLFSKIRSDPDYRPAKPTVFAFAIALQLDLAETGKLLAKAGYTIFPSSKFDVVLQCCIQNKFYDVGKINEVLYEYGLPQMGSAVRE